MIWRVQRFENFYLTLSYRVSGDCWNDQFLSCTVSYCRSEYSAFWRCVKAGAAYLVTQLCKVKTDSSRVE